MVDNKKRLKPTEEKVWGKHYDDGVLERVDNIPKQTIFDFLQPTLKKYSDKIKIRYGGVEIPWSTIEANADLLARALRGDEFGVEPDMVVPVYAFFTPGMGAIIKAMNDAGICSYFLKLSSSFEELKAETIGNLEMENPQAKMAPVAILFDGYYKISKDIRKVLDDDRFKKVLVVSASDFLQTPKSKMVEMMLYFDKLKNNSCIPNNKKYIRYNKALQMGNYYTGNYRPEFKENRWFAITTSSGTSMKGVKPVIATNEAAIGQMIQCDEANFGYNIGDSTYTNFPPTTSTSLVCVFLYALYKANTLIMDPTQSIEMFYKKIMKAKPNNFIAPGTWLEQFFYEVERDLNNGKIKPGDLKFFNNIMMGGEGLPPRVWDWITSVAKRAGIKEGTLGHGWGLTEGFAPMAKHHKAQIKNPNPRKHSVLSVGPVMPAFTIGSFDEDGNELDYNEPGELQAISKLITPGYYNKPELTKEILGEKTKDGKTKLMTGDYGYVDENGEVYLIGRMNEAIRLSNGKKLQLPVIAAEIRDSHPIIKDCIVLKIQLEDGSEVLTAHLATWTDHQYLCEEAIKEADKKMAEYLPKEIKMVGYWDYGRVLTPDSTTGKISLSILANQTIFKKPYDDEINLVSIQKNKETGKYTIQLSQQKESNKVLTLKR